MTAPAGEALSDRPTGAAMVLRPVAPVQALRRSEKSVAEFRSDGEGYWRLHQWASPRLIAAVASRRLDATGFLRKTRGCSGAVSAEQIHGASVGMIGGFQDSPNALAGCDALISAVPGMALLIRTADCLPLFFAAPSQGVVGIAHAGWRGISAELPARVVACLRHAYHVGADELFVAIGPAIRSCCYEVGPEFRERFGPFMCEREGRRTCDLIGAAVDQLRRCGVRAPRIWDTQRCSACETQEWFSLRREGPVTGRLTSLIMLLS